jgi:pyrimidine oxygenase
MTASTSTRSPGLPNRAPRPTSNKDTNVRQLAAPEGAVNINMGTLVGSYATIARMLDEMAEVPNTGGVLLTFDDFLEGVEAFGTRIQPLMKCRARAPMTIRIRVGVQTRR